MRIAQVAPLYESVPPELYGGTERIVSYLTEELVAQGHRVTLFASGDSKTAAELVPTWERGIRLDPRGPDPIAVHELMLQQLLERANQFDVIHFHIEPLYLQLARRLNTACVATLHGRLDIPALADLYREFRDVPLVSISAAQRAPLPDAHWQATVHHGLPLPLHECGRGPGDYLAFLGRVAPEKGVDRAIDIARRAGVPLRIAAKVDPAERDYFVTEIEPRIDGRSVVHVGEIDESQKTSFLGNALALLFPIDWPEPFGLVMIEAMACGTPVIAFRSGSVPEIIDEDVTGFIVDGVEEAVSCVPRARLLDRHRCRAVFERRFSAARMARDYCRVYETLVKQRRMADRSSASATAGN
jgi:glycosyltransferase involved in cell wall biosynthesis